MQTAAGYQEETRGSSVRITTADQRQRHRGGESSAEYASLRRSDGSVSSCIADGESSADNGPTAATEHASRGREQRRLCGHGGATTATEHMHRDGESRADYRYGSATALLSRRRERGRPCLAMATRWQRLNINRDGETMHRYGVSTTHYATRRREQSWLATISQAATAATYHAS